MKAPKKQLPESRKRPGNPRINEVNKATQFKPGHSGNPGGRPKGTSISKLMMTILEETDPKTKKQIAEKVARKIIQHAEDNASFTNILLDRTEGRVVEKVEVSVLENLADEIAEGRKRAAAKEK
jgi:hypothetical protein